MGTASDGLGFESAAALEHLKAADPEIGRVVDTVGPFHLELQATPSAFGALAEAIVYQQLTGRAAATIFDRLCALFPDRAGSPTAEEIAGLSPEALRGVGLSRAKQLSLHDLARKSLDGTVPPLSELSGMDDEEVVERLTAVRGIGRWTAEMFLIFRLGRPDVLPLGDHGLRRGFAAAFGLAGLPSAEEIAARGRRWAPYRTVASWYLWRAAEGGGLGPVGGATESATG